MGNIAEYGRTSGTEEAPSKASLEEQVALNPETRGSSGRRRRFTSHYKLNVLRQADLCSRKPDELASLLRREGLYSSILALWRKQREEGALAAMSAKRGRKPKYTPVELEVQELRRENQQLAEKLRQAELIMEAQKKIAELLGTKSPREGD